MSLPVKLYLVCYIFDDPDGDGSQDSELYHPKAIYEDADKAVAKAKENSNKNNEYLVLYVEDGVVDDRWIYWRSNSG